MNDIGIWRGGSLVGKDRDSYNPETVYENNTINDTKYKKGGVIFTGAAGRRFNRGDILSGKGLRDGLIAYYRFENNTNDSYRQNHLVGGTGAVYESGILGNGIKSAANWYVNISSPEFTKPFYQTEVSLSLWVKPQHYEANEAGCEVGWDNLFNLSVSTFDNLSNKLSINLRGPTIIPVPENLGVVDLNLLPEDLVHIVLINYGLYFKLYLNGNLISQHNYYTGPVGDGNIFDYSARFDNHNFSIITNVEWDTLVDEIGIWNLALEPHQVAYLYNNGRGFDPTK